MFVTNLRDSLSIVYSESLNLRVIQRSLMPDALNRANQHHPIWFVNCLTNINNLNETAKLSLQKIVEIFSNKSLHDSKLIPNVVLPKANET